MPSLGRGSSFGFGRDTDPRASSSGLPPILGLTIGFSKGGLSGVLMGPTAGHHCRARGLRSRVRSKASPSTRWDEARNGWARPVRGS